MLERALKTYLDFVIRRAGTVALVVGLLAAACGTWLVAFRPLALDTNFTTLLPDDLPCVIESRRTAKLVGSTDYLTVAVESPVVADNIAFVDALAAKLAELPELDWVSTVLDKSYFRDHRLLYLDLEDLDVIADRAKARLDFEKKIRNPFYVSLDDEQPPDIGFEDVMDRYRERLARRGAGGMLEEDDEKSDGGDAGKSDAEGATGPSVIDRYAAEGGRLMSVVSRPNRPALDMDFGRELVEKVERLIAETDPKRNPEMKVEVAGPYRNRYREYRSVVGDIFSSLGVALGLILTIIVGYFRRVRTVALIFVPLVAGILFTVGLTALTLGRLNMTTALIFAVLLGLGIDFGVHMSVRYLDERARGRSLEESLVLAVIKTGKAIVTAGLTTAGALAVLTLAQFKGFSEFGIIATTGIATCLLTYTVLLPALAVLFERVSAPRAWRRRDEGTALDLRPVTWRPGRIAAGLAVIVALTVAGLAAIPDVEFEYNFKKLRGKRSGTTIKYGRTLGQGSSPVVAVMPTMEDARVLTRHLESIVDADTERKDLLKKVFSVFSFIPDDQEAKLERLARLGGYVDQALRLAKLDEQTRARLEKIRRWTEAEPIGLETLPDWVRTKFEEKDGTVGRMVYLYPRVNEWKVLQMEGFYKEYGTIDVPGKGAVHPAASGFIMVEVVRAVQRDGWLMTVAATVVVLIMLLIDLRSPTKALLVFAPLLVGGAWTIGLMALFGIKITLYNMLVLPTMLGIGIDASVHLFHAYEEHGPGSLVHSLKTTGVAIVVAAATTAVGFAGMLVVSHQGLGTIGLLALTGIGATLVGALVTLPLELALVETVRNRRRGSQA